MKCPHCEWPFNYDEVFEWYLLEDLSRNFNHDCPQCNETFPVIATAVPEFELLHPNKAPEPA